MPSYRTLQSGRRKYAANVRFAPGDVRGFSTRASECQPAWKRAKVARDAPGAGRCKQTENSNLNPVAPDYKVKTSSYAKQASWRDACWVLSDMSKAKVKLDVISYTAAISACRKGGQWQQALGLFRAMLQEKVLPDVISYNAAISAGEKGGQWQQALGLFGAMLQARVSPDVISYNAAISACEKGGQWQQALDLFGAMLQANVLPRVISYSAAISACEKGGQWQQALGLFGAMIQARVSRDVISYNAAISACEKGGQWQQALDLFGAMPQAKVLPDAISYSSAISACEKGGQWQQALGLFGAMPQAKVQPTVFSYSAAITACKKCGQWQQTLGLFGAMLQAEVLANTTSYNALLDAVFDKPHGQHFFESGLSAQVFPKLVKVRPDIIDLHDLSEGTAQLAVRWWLATVVVSSFGKRLGTSEQYNCILVTGYGRSRKGWDTTDVQAAVLSMLRTMKLNARVLESNAGRLQLVLSKRDTPLLQQCFKCCKQRRGDQGALLGIGKRRIQVPCKVVLVAPPTPFSKGSKEPEGGGGCNPDAIQSLKHGGEGGLKQRSHCLPEGLSRSGSHPNLAYFSSF